MGPRTRARDKSAAAAAAASKTYSHSSPAPVQVRFPARHKAVRTYGRARPSLASLRQQTLTQLDYMKRPADDIEEPDALLVDEEDEERGRKKRRKTMGDTPSSSFHTQTLTQLLSSGDKDDGERDDGDGGGSGGLDVIGDSEGDDSELGSPPRHRRQQPRGSVVPQTPGRQRIDVDLTEAPSLASTADTPTTTLVAPARRLISPIRSPLQDKSPNVGVPPPSAETAAKTRPRRLVIADSYSSAVGTPSPEKPSSPLAARPAVSSPVARRQSKVSRESLELGEMASEGATAATPPGVTRPKDPVARTPRTSLGRSLFEIPDSDDDLESLGPSPVKAAMTTRAEGTPGPKKSSPLRGEEQNREASAEVGDSSEEGPGTPTPLARRRVRLDLSSTQVPETSPPPPPQEERTSRRNSQQESPPQTTPRPVRGLAAATQARSQAFTQGLESQRVPLEAVRSTGPTTDRSDIILSIHPGPTEDIVRGAKNHEFRNYKIPEHISRVWIYVTQPVCELRYMAMLGPAKEPGELGGGRDGLGNAEFDAGRSGYKFAHELLQVYQLNNPVPLATMRENGWMGAAPQKYVYVPPAVVGQLLGNLRCALFYDEEEGGNENGPDLSVSQQLEEQIRDDIVHSTQVPPPQPPSSSQPQQSRKKQHELEMGASQSPSYGRGPATRAGRRRATAGGTTKAPPIETGTPRARQHQIKQGQARAASRHTGVDNSGGGDGGDHNFGLSQATTASEPSSPAMNSQGKSDRRPPAVQSSSSPNAGSFPFSEYGVEEEAASSTRLPGESFPLTSSQVMVPESLLMDNARRPPAVILDSDDEDWDG